VFVVDVMREFVLGSMLYFECLDLVFLEFGYFGFGYLVAATDF